MTGWLFGTFLATSGLILLVLLLREPVRRRFGSRVAYGLWLLPAARLLMPTLTQTVQTVALEPDPLSPANWTWSWAGRAAMTASKLTARTTAG